MVDTKLQSLVQIVENGSFTKAAEALGLTQPAVSQHVRLLEEEFGVKIFDHSHNRFQLTPEGELIVGFARREMALYRNLLSALKDQKTELRSLTIGITHSAESSNVIEALAAYVSHFDDLNLKLLTKTTDKLYGMLKNFEVDFAIMEGSLPDPDLCSMLVDTDSLVLVVSPNHALADRKTVPLERLREEKMILRLPNSNTRNLFKASLESQGRSVDEFNVVMEIDSVASIKDLVRRKFGVSVLSKSACMDEIRKGKLVALRIEELTMRREIHLVYHKDYEHREFLEGIVETYRSL